MRFSRITKIAGVSFAGFVAASVVADKANIGPLAAQVAGFAGAFVGSLVARRKTGQQAGDRSKPSDSLQAQERTSSDEGQ